MTPKRIRRRTGAFQSTAALSVSELVAELRSRRGAKPVESGLAAMLPVSTLPGVDAAAELLLAHRDGRVLVVGDFDADGATSTALVLRCLKRFGFDDTGYLVPNRFDFGYGLSAPLADLALESRPSLIVTVDNGISSHAGIDRCIAAGVDVLVTDHHLPGPTLPAATVIVNPNAADSTFQSKTLAGVGVAFYVMAALGHRLASAGQTDAASVPARYLDLVALGTVADVVGLDRNNRILVAEGLRRIRAGRAVPGLLALLTLAGRDPRDCVASDLAFAAGPRLNAAGRMEDMSIGIETLLSDSPAEARVLAGTLDTINHERRLTEKRMQDSALERIDSLVAGRDTTLPDCISLAEPDWHQGVVGLVASRVRERVQRPVFAFAKAGDGELKGSGRSIAGVHLRDLLAFLDATEPGLMLRFGGHAMAAGLTLPSEHFERFAERSAAAVTALYPEADFDPVWLSDGALSPPHLTLDVAEALRSAGPWGQGFAEPVFDGHFVVHEARIVGDDHLKLTVASIDGGSRIAAIAFRQAAAAPLPPGAVVELVYRLDVNVYRGMRLAQLVVEQIAPVPD